VVGNRIVSPITIVNGLGEKGYTQLTRNAPYKDLNDFVRKNLSKRPGADRSALSRPMTHKMICAGLLNDLFPPDKTLHDKLKEFEEAYAYVREEKVQAVPEAFGHLTALGEYMIKKQLVNVYSADLRPVILPERGGTVTDRTWCLNDGTKCLDGHHLLDFKNMVESGLFQKPATVAAIAYVVDEKPKPYANKTKQANVLYLDVNGTFFEEILWPDWEANDSPTGFKGVPVILIYETYYSKKKETYVMSLKHVVRTIEDKALFSYSTMK
jgi:DNA polymerase III alpha subunit